MYHFTLKATFPFSVTHLFDAFHKPDLLMQWFAPGDVQITQVMSNFAEGGRYRVSMMEPSGDSYSLTGQFATILANEELVFSWAWEDNREESVITSVDIKFEALGPNLSSVHLLHSGFMNKTERDQHQLGWVDCLEKLSQLKF
ncbi:SRPBCC domain-containing protein [Alteromonas aestuariivivens]|uniref:SRPBCC domain-containing protein n=1 Tax=Alteromonas aestuariivivens TaxID=1938339 RepID=A0A3D8ME00_9ALTE|nr:SRPBCC domain-containing protein [Alteromonas aestuariivivens]RDV28973.1 SRPBCC domain-containing protein [Alteromonas aestuariivivens]